MQNLHFLFQSAERRGIRPPIMKTPKLQQTPSGGSDHRLVMLDSDGDKVTDGDEITFSYGIPPVRVCAQVEAFEGELWALTPGHNPSRCRLSELRDHVELFYKA